MGYESAGHLVEVNASSVVSLLSQSFAASSHHPMHATNPLEEKPSLPLIWFVASACRHWLSSCWAPII